ncbi:hypothetical protein PDM99_29270 [Bacillus cereus group sp. Bc200]|uniref:hypothetical protein n=1 Tax=Bacillus cereus group sp. Bc200 TaxID=3018112 RepID=UPI0022E1F492|nr:hypothetical protein [Bacillus cereus group sp. Bc200]MDA2264250.1 hypothetical protein [Bacillus cereus group sp. Bc200]
MFLVQAQRESKMNESDRRHGKASAFIMPRQAYFALLESRRMKDGGTIRGILLNFLILRRQGE